MACSCVFLNTSNSCNMTDRVNSLNVCAKCKKKLVSYFPLFNGISFYMILSVSLSLAESYSLCV